MGTIGVSRTINDSSTTIVPVCVTLNDWPAIVSVALRAAPPFAATLKVTDAGPLPLAPDMIVIQSTGLDAIHVHPSPAVTAIVPDPPTTSNDCDVGAIENVHPEACSTVNDCPATEIVPVRAGPELGATLNSTDPEPDLFAPAGIEIQLPVVVAFHPQPAEVVTAMLPVPPTAGID
jgi:hypothetical protein